MDGQTEQEMKANQNILLKKLLAANKPAEDQGQGEGEGQQQSESQGPSPQLTPSSTPFSLPLGMPRHPNPQAQLARNKLVSAMAEVRVSELLTDGRVGNVQNSM